MKKLLFALLMVAGLAAQAQDVGIVLGMRSDNADSDDSAVKITGKNSFQGGAIAKFDLKDKWQIRSGFIYTQRAFEVGTPGSKLTTDFKFTYFEVPANLLYKFSDYGGAFVGPAIAFNVSKDCGAGTCSGVNSSPLFLQLGASFKFAPQLGAEIYYEMGLSKLADHVTSPKAVMANILITFD